MAWNCNSIHFVDALFSGIYSTFLSLLHEVIMTQVRHQRSRRKTLVATTAVVGGVGLGAVVTALVQSLKPSADVLLASAEGVRQVINLGNLALGQSLKIDVMHQPIIILHRTSAQLQRLAEVDAHLADPASIQSQQPEFAKNRFRSMYPQFLIVNTTCTHLGCVVKQVSAEDAPSHAGNEGLPEGFFACPCHAAKFDLAGRVLKGMSAPTNLVVPNYKFISATEVVFAHHKDNF